MTSLIYLFLSTRSAEIKNRILRFTAECRRFLIKLLDYRKSIIQARREKKSLSFVITELLKARYGEPDSAAPPEAARPDPAVEPAAKTFDPDELFGTGSTEIL